jgi:N-acetylglucosamine-6-phosphate deacetylase
VPEPLLIRGLSGSPSEILVEDGRIAALGADAANATTARPLDADGWTAHPGFIDLQVNGIGALDFTSDPGSIGRAGPKLARHGVTSFLPTIVSSPRGTVESAIDAWRGTRGQLADGARPLGLHVEGPFLAPGRAGAHDPAQLREPDLEEIARWAEAGVRLITLAPELERACEAIELMTARGTIAAIGHTDADAATTARAVDAGARYATHLFNAMPPLAHRDPGPVGALLSDERVTIGLIADGRHVDPLVLALAARAMRGRLSLVSDSVGDRLGAQPLADGHRPDRVIAGGTDGLDAGVRTMAGLIGLEAAIDAVTTVPASLLGLEDGRGELRVGGVADIVLLTPELTVAATISEGHPAAYAVTA